MLESQPLNALLNAFVRRLRAFCSKLLAPLVEAHVLRCFRCTSSAGLQTRTRNILAARPRTSVEYNAITSETFQDMVNHSAIIEMFSPVGKHASDDLFTLKLSHNLTSRCSYVSERCSVVFE
jgi:hypothetical protein